MRLLRGRAVSLDRHRVLRSARRVPVAGWDSVSWRSMPGLGRAAGLFGWAGTQRRKPCASR